MGAVHAKVEAATVTTTVRVVSVVVVVPVVWLFLFNNDRHSLEVVNGVRGEEH